MKKDDFSFLSGEYLPAVVAIHNSCEKRAIIIKTFLSLICLTCIAIVARSQDRSDQDIILTNVREIPLPPDSVHLLATYPINYQTQTIAYFNLNYHSGRQLYAPSIITGRYGKGKILVVGSDRYLKEPLIQNENVRQLWKNIIGWSLNNNKQIGIEGSEFDRIASIAKDMDVKATIFDQHRFNNLPVIFITREPLDSMYIQRLANFVYDGGTLVYVSSLWNLFEESKYATDTTRMNEVLTKAGLYHKAHHIFVKSASDTMFTSSIPKYFTVDSIISNIENFRYKELFYQKDEALVPLNILKLILSAGPKNSKALNDLYRITDDPLNKYSDTASLKKPLDATNWPNLLKYLVRLQRDNEASIMKHTYRATTNSDFPGIVPDNALRVTRPVKIKYSNAWSGLREPPITAKRRYSTGLYVAPGDLVKIVLKNKNDTARNIAAQIGAHEDDVSGAGGYSRNPQNLTKIFAMDQDTITIYSLYGGLLYFNIPVADAGNIFEATVINAIEAPYFQLGKTSRSDWIQHIRNRPAPWAELCSDKLILTVPSDSIRALNDPEKLMRFWDEVMDANADLAVISRKRVHPERIIVDNDIRWGYMFTLPSRIMIPNDESVGQLLNESYMKKSGSWGLLHEIGHRHQFYGLDFVELTEVSVNLYTLYTYNKVIKKGIYQSREDNTRESVERSIKEYIKNPDYDKWKTNPFLMLHTLYYPVIDTFGWQAIQKLNASLRKIYNIEYKNLKPYLKKKENDDRRNRYFVLFSKALGKNLGSYFDKLKIPISDEAKMEVKDLPVWMPDWFK
ncbi:M60 family metallopeptidase [Niabella drilacis]|uniref:Peptidase M60, enhancin and enhancin-like n=1 Tax=Niabella drilacis (strain DSM 25811 / CCM 8410 / CCUG 62505 / LMG 26954 / E90) TaxID=1285928 RepID=A0A1G6QUU3_NIADE|nr:M60 family metallopeptidase [Niabella drilacis]SDC96140.1 Peptidase M60, enhancin and enhancin-like [Niabella drilacis]